MQPSNDFSSVVLETLGPSPCSPVPRGLGVLVRAPTHVIAEAPFRIPLCISWMLDDKWTPPQGVLAELGAVVEHPDWEAPRVIGLTPESWSPPLKDEQIPLEPGTSVGGYYNPDLVAHGGLPCIAGPYRIRVQIGGLRSRPIEVTAIAPRIR